MHAKTTVSSFGIFPSDRLQWTLYAGIALIVGSTAFLMRDTQSEYFLIHLGMSLIAPLLFYTIGALAMRYLRAVLVPRGILATGAWLLTVALLHLSGKSSLIPGGESAFWTIGSVLVAAIVTYTGHRVKFALLYPLVIVTQANALWAVLGGLWIEPQWIAPLSLGLAALWWEAAPRYVRDATWIKVYRASSPLLIAFAVGLSLFLRENAHVSPLSSSLTLITAGALVLWIGARRTMIAAHGGVWMIAGGWMLFYIDWLGDTGSFGLWVSLVAVGALLIERVWSTINKGKRKGEATVYEAITRWALADLALGLSVIILLWTARNLGSAPPVVMTITLMVICGVWITAGLLYRLPALLHTALWVLPLPYALLLVLLRADLWSLPLMGIEWQLLALVYLLIGHGLANRRPAIRMPFFAAGYMLLAFGLTFTLTTRLWLPISLLLTVLATGVTAVLVITDRHPTWDDLVERLFNPMISPFVHQNMRNLFLLVSTWLGGLWVLLMLDYTGRPISEQGMILVVISAGWFVAGRMLMDMPRVSGWMMYSAGWIMWLAGLAMVFFTPADAIITAVIGLTLCGEAIARTKAGYWIPLAVLQIGFVVLQCAWLFALNAHVLLMVLMVGITIGGYALEARGGKRLAAAGEFAALTGIVLALALTLVKPTTETAVGLWIISVVAMIRYRKWWLMIPPNLLGAVSLSLIFHAMTQQTLDLLLVVGLAANIAVGLWIGGRKSGIVPTLFAGITMLGFFPDLYQVPYAQIDDRLGAYASVVAGIAVLLRVGVLYGVGMRPPFGGLRSLVWWVRPMNQLNAFFAACAGGVAFEARVYDPYSPGLYIVFRW
ncbi:MAG: hypothetical protein U0670_17755 [Anaerolineae bacterium]